MSAGSGRFRSTYEFGVQSPFVLYAAEAYERASAMLEEALAEGGPWILGDQLTLVDINLMPYAARLDYLASLKAVQAHREGATSNDVLSFLSGD